MLKIVLDTNMFLSAFLYGGMTKTIFDHVLNNKLELFISPALKLEVLKKFKDFGADEETLDAASFFLDAKGILINPDIKVAVCRDSKDNFVLELAQVCKANYIITRDKDLLSLPQKKWKETIIIKPEDFLPLLRKKLSS